MSGAQARVVAYLGGHGSFSEEASRRLAPAHELMPLADFAAVGRAVYEGTADVGVLPLSNSHAGSIDAARILLAHPELRVVRQEAIDVRLHLLGTAGATLDTVSQVSSHPAALIQCRRFLEDRPWVTNPAASTACAAQDVAAAGDPAKAAIASHAAALAYGLEVLANDVQGEEENVTLFALVERRDQFA